MLSSDGKILVVATISSVKVFSVRRRKSDEKGTLRIQKLDIPSTLANDGARVVTVSPDSRWICVVRPNSATYLARIKPASSPQEKSQVLTQLVKLNRATRHARYEKASHGTLGDYEKTIRCAVFSENSKIFAVGDLSGCVDAWSLEKAESKTLAKANAAEDSDEDSDDEDEQPVVEGERWTLTAAESPIPRLRSGVLLLSFRPLNPAGKKLLADGADQDSKVESRLMALTSEHQLVEVDALDGKLSDWSRRNPKAFLPAEFRGVKDRAMGCVWDLNEACERLWLYGTSWLWMFDLNQDFPSPEELSASADTHDDGQESMQAAKKSSSQKRKRGLLDDEENDRKRSNTGAGDRIPLAQSDVFFGSKIRKIIGSDESKAELISLEKERPRGADEDDEAYDHDEAYTARHDSNLARLRRGNLEGNDVSTPRKQPPKTAVNGDTPSQKQLMQAADNSHSARRWWHTYKYRDILGIVPLNCQATDEESQEHEDGGNLEVAVVERPMWDVELPGRYVRDYE